jgi:hypothetical protein
MRGLRALRENALRPWLRVDELRNLPGTTRLLLVGLIGCCGLAVVASVTAVAAIEIAAQRAAPGAAQDPGAIKLARSDGEAVLQRPVFSRSRQAARPVIASPQVAPPPPPLPALAARDSEVRLKGVFMNAPLVKAFLISAQNPLGAWVKPEEVFGGWKVVAVQPSEIELEGGGERLRVALGAGSPANEPKTIVQNFRPNPPFRR